MTTQQLSDDLKIIYYIALQYEMTNKEENM